MFQLYNEFLKQYYFHSQEGFIDSYIKHGLWYYYLFYKKLTDYPPSQVAQLAMGKEYFVEYKHP